MYLPLALQDHVVGRYGQPGLPLENWRAEPCPEIPGREVKLVPTAGLVERGDTISGTPGALFQSFLLFNSDLVVSAGTSIYRRTATGTVSTLATGLPSFTYRPKFAVSQTPQLGLVQGGNAYHVEAGGVTQLTIGAASGAITDIDLVDNRHLFVEQNSGRLWFSEPGDIASVAGNLFITAEADPDPLVAVTVFGQSVYCFGTETIQVARPTGQTTPAFFLQSSRTLQLGIYGRRSVCKSEREVFFIGSTGRVFAMRFGQPEVISTEPIATLLQGVPLADRDGVTMESWVQGGTEFVMVTIPDVGQYIYDLTTGFWHRRKRVESWHGGLGPIIQIDGGVFCLEEGSTSAPLLQLDRAVYTDRGNLIRRTASVPLFIADERATGNALAVETFTGHALDGSVQGSEPILELSVAHDGHSFCHPIRESLGRIGEHRRRVIFGPIGQFEPGLAMLRLSMADPVGVTLLGVQFNPMVRT